MGEEKKMAGVVRKECPMREGKEGVWMCTMVGRPQLCKDVPLDICVSLSLGYERGRKDMAAELNTPRRVITKAWEYSVCQNCGKDFSDFEECDDGYIRRAESLERCPYCGQKITWYDDLDFGKE